MTIFTNQGGRGNSGSIGPIGGMIMLALFFVLLYFVARGVFTILSFVAPILFIITLIMDYTIVTDYVKTVLKTLKTNLLFGIVLILLTIFGFPIVSGYLFFKAYLKRTLKGKIEEVEQKRFADYEVVEEEYDDFLELPEMVKPEIKEKSSDYDNMFE